MLPEPLTTARTSFATSRMNCTVPEPPTVTSSRVAVPLPVERATTWQRHLEALGLDAVDDDVAAAGKRQRVEGRDVDLDAHRAPRREAAGSVRDDEPARLHLGRDAVEEVVVGPHDDGLLLADANHHVVAPCEVDAVEPGHMSGLRRGYAGSLAGRGGRASEHVGVIQHCNRQPAEEEGQGRDEHPSEAVPFSARVS